VFPPDSQYQKGGHSEKAKTPNSKVLSAREKRARKIETDSRAAEGKNMGRKPDYAEQMI